MPASLGLLSSWLYRRREPDMGLLFCASLHSEASGEVFVEL